MPGDRIQTNLRLSAASAAALEMAAAIEGKDKGRIVEEALALRERIQGEQYQAILRAALALRFSDDPAERLRAAEVLREDVEGSASSGAVSASAVRDRIRKRMTASG
jgi:hypothetical protein